MLFDDVIRLLARIPLELVRCKSAMEFAITGRASA